MTFDDDPGGRLALVRERIARAALRSGRRPEDVRLVAVSKTHPVESIRAAAAAGQRDFGENRVQEALPKIDAGRDLALRWHLVGHLQANKARKAAAAFHCIHSVDSLALLDAVERTAAETGGRPEVLVQVDMAAETTKHGVPVEQLAALVEAGTRCRAARLAGLMILPPFLEDPEAVRPYFRRLRELRDGLVADGIADAPMLRELSMGMSHDFEVAVEEGATMVRVGTAIFGARPPVTPRG